MGMTKQQKWYWGAKEARKRREYDAWLMQQAKERAERIETVGMLLDANWSNSLGVFIKVTRTQHANGLASHWETFYNEVGEEVPRPKGYNSV